DEPDRVVTPARSADAALDAEVLPDDVQAAVRRLPPEYRAAVVLSDVVGLSYQEISEALDVPVGTVRSRLHRGRALLRRAPRRPARDRRGGRARDPPRPDRPVGARRPPGRRPVGPARRRAAGPGGGVGPAPPRRLPRLRRGIPGRGRGSVLGAGLARGRA